MEDEQQDEQLDFGDDGEEYMGMGADGYEDMEGDGLGQHAEDEAAYEEQGNYDDQAEDDDLAGLGDDDMHDEQPEADLSNRHAQDKQPQRQEQQSNPEEQDGQQQKQSGSKVIDLTQPSKKWLERTQASGRQQPPRQQQQQQQQQEKRGPDAAGTHPAPSSTARVRSSGSGSVRGPLRYFIVKSINVDNWVLAQRESCWATQQHNESVFNAAYKNGQEVVLFMSINGSGAIQGYGRMTSLSGQVTQPVPWLDIDREAARNFGVSWDCLVPLPFELVKSLQNPWSDPKLGAHSKGSPLPLRRHRDGQELAPQIGEQLLEAMNLKAASVNKPATGPLAMGVGRGVVAGPGWQQQRQPMPPQMQMQQQRMMMMQQQQRGMGPGRGMMGPGGPMMGHGPNANMGPHRAMPGRGMQQQPPPPNRPLGPGPHRPGGAGPGMGPIANDPRLNPRFKGRLQMDGMDEPPLSNAASRGRSPPPYSRSGDRDRDEWEREHRHDSRDRRYEQDHSRDWGHGPEQHHSRSRHYSRSRSRSPPRSRGGSNGRMGGAGVAESSWGDGSPKQQRQHDDAPESMQDMSYEQYLATWEKVQQRLKLVSAEANQQQQQQLPGQQQQQQQQQLLPPAQQQQMAGGANGVGVGSLMSSAGAGGMVGVGPGVGGVGGRMMAAGGGTGPGPAGMMRQSIAAAGGAADGVQGPGRSADIPTLAQYMLRIKTKCAERGQPCPPDDVIKAKYQEKMAQMQQGQQLQRVPQQQQQGMQQMQQVMPGMAGGAGPGMGMGPAAVGMNAMNPMMAAAAMNPMNMMAAAAMGMMASGAGAMMSAGMAPMMGPAAAGGAGMGGMAMQPGMGPGAGMMGRGGGGRGRSRGGRGQMMMPMGGF